MNWRERFSVVGLAHLGWWMIVVNTVLSLFLGLIALLFGDPFSVFGSGPGGGNGIPDLVFLLAALLGLPGLVKAINGLVKRKDGNTRWGLVFVGPLLISFGYILIAHAVDPCFNGIWDMSSRIGDSIRLCERFGSELNVDTRFHYFWHIFWALPLIWLYGLVLKRKLPEVLRYGK